MDEACILSDVRQPGPTVSRGMLDIFLLQALQRRHLVWHSQALLAVSSLFWWRLKVLQKYLSCTVQHMANSLGGSELCSRLLCSHTVLLRGQLLRSHEKIEHKACVLTVCSLS